MIPMLIYSLIKKSRRLFLSERYNRVHEDGFIIEKVNIEPKMVTIKGIKNDLLKIRNVSTEPIEVSGIKENASFEVRLNAPSGLAMEDLSTDRVKVNFQVGVSKINKRFGSIPIEVSGTDYIADVNPSYIYLFWFKVHHQTLIL